MGLFAGLLGCVTDISDGVVRPGGSCLQPRELLARRLDLSLKVAVLLRADLAIGQLLRHRLLRRDQHLKLVLSAGDRLGEDVLLLRKQDGVGGIKLEQRLDAA